MFNVVVLGGLGNMGRRYCTILRHIGVTPIPIDTANNSIAKLESAINLSQGVIIATPTSQHVADILDLSTLGVPILVEKPISKIMSRVEHCVKECEKNKTPLAMINQYQRLVVPDDIGPSHYDYWNHGRDGMAWDCISVVALANGEIRLGETSPVWNCMINGRQLDQAKMDGAYLSMIINWRDNPVGNSDYIITAHEKVHEYVRTHE